MRLCSRSKIVPTGVTLPFLLFVQSKLLFEGCRDLLCGCTSAESTETMLVTMILLQIILHVLDCGLSMVPVLCHKVKCCNFLTHNRTSVKGILRLAKQFERVAAKTGNITHPSAFISLPLYCVTWLNSLLNGAKPGYGGLTAQSWLNLLILECCLRKDGTLSIKC